MNECAVCHVPIRNSPPGVTRKHCSRACLSIAAASMAHLTERFWRKVEKTDTCWLWRGALGSMGYGAFGSPGVSLSAHRFAWEMVNGPIPAGMVVCHRCDVRNCVRNDGDASHLFLGTQAMNIQDAVRKGHKWRGLNAEQVREVRRRLSNGLTVRAIAVEMGIPLQTITGIRSGRTYSAVDG